MVTMNDPPDHLKVLSTELITTQHQQLGQPDPPSTLLTNGIMSSMIIMEVMICRRQSMVPRIKSTMMNISPPPPTMPS